ncbi:MAG: HAD hydrolase-like protein [Candidatus Nanoarchaeia archaeon]|jgi:phosphoglycolate phosphatase-like HAD superfamily hydrolase
MSEDVDRLWGKKWFEYFEDLLPDKTNKHHLELQQACFELSNACFDITEKHIKLTPGALEVLNSIKSAGHDQIIISNTGAESLPLFLNAVSITQFFPTGKAFAVDSHVNPTRNKRDVLKEFLKNKTYDEIIIIGDSPSDMALKQVAGGKTFLYSHANKTHRVCTADYKINDLKELLKEI